MTAGDELFTCQNCGQPVLQTDNSCWHCGAILNFPDLAAHEVAGDQKPKQTGQLLQAAFYAAMTALTLTGLLLVVNALGHQPRLSANYAGSDTPARALVGSDASFSINVPVGLKSYFPNDQSSGQAVERQMLDEPRFIAALQPLAQRAPDLELLLLASAESRTLTLARSERLGGISVEDVLAYAARNSTDAANIINMGAASGQGGDEIAILTVQQTDTEIMCRQHIIPKRARTYLAAMCSEQHIFEEKAAEFDAVLASLIVR